MTALGDERPHVLVTGAAGLIGRILLDGLADEYAVHGLDVRRGPGVEHVVEFHHDGHDQTVPSRSSRIRVP